VVEEFENQPESLVKISGTEIQNQFALEEPFVFVIINSEDYKKQKVQYKAAGFEEITIEKASWYVQEMYREIRNQLKPEEEMFFTASKDSPDNDYYERNAGQIENFVLENGIPLTVKKNSNSSDVAFLISIKGGELNSSANHGFEEVMINIMAGMIQKEVLLQQMNHVILGNVTITPQTGLAASSILISCIPQDFNTVCSACAKAMIYGEIPPALADRAVSSRQYKKRLENGSAVRQLYSSAILTIFGKSAMSSITGTTGDILQTTDYKSILQAYPEFLDGSKFSLILTGDFEEDAVNQVKKEFNLLAAKKKVFSVKKCTSKPLENKTVSVKIVHTFLTDVPAEKAGPMPAVLIPTTEFLDPLIYGFKAPETGSREGALFCALLNYLEGEIHREIDSSVKDERQKVDVRLPEYSLDYGFVIIQNVAHLRQTEDAVKRALQNLSAKLTSPVANSTVIVQIKNEWTKKQLEQTSSNRGTALLIQKGTELFPDSPKPEFYLSEYKMIHDAGPQDFIEAFKFFPAVPQLRVISKDSNN
jgi:zinc protease